jgi:hypothetical protein
LFVQQHNNTSLNTLQTENELAFRKTPYLQEKLRENFPRSPVKFPPKPGMASLEARYASLGARYRFPHCPVFKALSYRASGEEQMKHSNLPPKPGMQQGLKCNETLDDRLMDNPSATELGAWVY